jgi:hypothetical protein
MFASERNPRHCIDIVKVLSVAAVRKNHQRGFSGVRTPVISLSFVNANARGGRDTARSANGVANMDTAQIIAGLVLLLCIVCVAYFLAQQRTPPQRQIASTRRSQIEQDFARVFAMTSAQGKKGLIRRWMDRSGCDRTEAMRLATEEWRRDNR